MNSKMCILVFAVFLHCAYSDLGCKDENGHYLDWFVFYKIPQQTESWGDGTSYIFITSETKSKGWTTSEQKMGNRSSLTGQTLSPIYESNEDIWIVYNDQPPGREDDGSRETLSGHTKGVVGAGKSGGFWLVHSIPHFPLLGSYGYPDTGHKYGQSGLCISLAADELDLVGELLKYNSPNFVLQKLPTSLTPLYPKLVQAVKKKGKIVPPYTMTTSLTSKAGVTFKGFGKAANFGKDLYEWVANTLRTSIKVETWRHEPNLLPSICGKYSVLNIQSIILSGPNIEFSTGRDHSKWAVSSSADTPYVCIGDINRAEPQEKRGGGTVCIADLELWTAYNKTVQTADSCQVRI